VSTVDCKERMYVKIQFLIKKVVPGEIFTIYISKSESSKSPTPQDYCTSGHLCIVLHNLHSPTLPKPNAATCYSIVDIF